MWPVERIVAAGNTMRAAKTEMEAVLQKLNGQVDRIKSDGSRHKDWIDEKVREARDRALGELGPLMRSISENAAPVRDQTRFWGNTSLLLMMQRFDSDPLKDAIIRQAHLTELAALAHDELQAVADHARAENNLPMLWAAHLAGRRFADVKGATPIDISDVKIAAQADALRAINDCQALVAASEYVVAQTSGRVTAVQKLEFGRAMGHGANTQPADDGLGAAA